jgi:hypothetical protein
MIPNTPFRPTPVIAYEKLLETAAKLIRTNGYSATSGEQLCGEAGVTKGAFFHHLPDPVARVLGYSDLRIALLDGPCGDAARRARGEEDHDLHRRICYHRTRGKQPDVHRSCDHRR